METNKIYEGDSLDVLKTLPDNSIDSCISSPPYWSLRDYGIEGQLGNEDKFTDYIKKLIKVYKEVYRVLKPEGTCFVNLGDTFGTGSGGSYTHSPKQLSNKGSLNARKPLKDLNKSLLMIPERFAIAMIDEGWILRNQIIWHKPNQMPQSATDRFTVDFEKIFFFVKQPKYYFEQQLEPATGYDGRNDIAYKGGKKDVSISKHKRWKFKNLQDKGQPLHTMHKNRAKGIPDKQYAIKNMRAVWSINTRPFSGAHFAVFPETLVERMIKAGCPENGLVLDPFMGAGTTAVTARKLNRNYVGIELNPDYVKIANDRLYNELGMWQ